MRATWLGALSLLGGVQEVGELGYIVGLADERAQKIDSHNYVLVDFIEANVNIPLIISFDVINRVDAPDDRLRHASALWGNKICGADALALHARFCPTSHHRPPQNCTLAGSTRAAANRRTAMMIAMILPIRALRELLLP